MQDFEKRKKKGLKKKQKESKNSKKKNHQNKEVIGEKEEKGEKEKQTRIRVLPEEYIYDRNIEGMKSSTRDRCKYVKY